VANSEALLGSSPPTSLDLQPSLVELFTGSTGGSGGGGELISTLRAGAWLLSGSGTGTGCDGGQMRVRNVECPAQRTVLRDTHCGFTFESNRLTRQHFVAEGRLGAEFSTSWMGASAKSELNCA